MSDRAAIIDRATRNLDLATEAREKLIAAVDRATDCLTHANVLVYIAQQQLADAESLEA